MTKYPQTRIAQSRWTLPFTAVYAAAACLANGLATEHLWIQTALLALSTLMMAELNNANALIRIFSRTVSCSFLVMSTMAAFLLPSVDAMVAQVGLVGFYLYFLKSYQDQTASGWVFYAFFFVGIVSIVFVQVLFFMPILWVLLATSILAFSARTFFASLLGIAAPYWFVGAYYVYRGDLAFFARHFAELVRLGPAFDLAVLDSHRLVTGAFVLLLALLGAAHFLIYSYQDKIRTRMVYETFITLDLCIFALMAVQPQHFDRLIAMAIVTTAPLIGHYLALSHNKLSNLCFFAIIAMALGITAFNLWMP